MNCPTTNGITQKLKLDEAPHTDPLERIRPYSSTLFGFSLTFFTSTRVTFVNRIQSTLDKRLK